MPDQPFVIVKTARYASLIFNRLAESQEEEGKQDRGNDVLCPFDSLDLFDQVVSLNAKCEYAR